MAIRYKVTTFDRRSAIVFKTDLCKIYEKGKIVHKFPNTPGILVFKTRKRAEIFRISCGNLTKIIRVKPLGRGKRVQKVISLHALPDFIGGFRFEELHKMLAPEGTMGYDAVEVLD